MLANQLEAKMRVGRVEIEAAAVELLDRFLELATGGLATAARLLLNRRFDHGLFTPIDCTSLPMRFARNLRTRRYRTPLGGGLLSRVQTNRKRIRRGFDSCPTRARADVNWPPSGVDQVDRTTIWQQAE